MIEWLDQVIPGEREVAKVAMVRGQRFAAIAEWRPEPASPLRYIVVLESARNQPAVFEEMAGARKYVEHCVNAVQ